MRKTLKKVEKNLIRTNLKSIEQSINNPSIIRVHRSFMINLDMIQTIHPQNGTYNIELEHVLNFSVKVSKSHKEAFEKRIKNQ